MSQTTFFPKFPVSVLSKVMKFATNLTLLQEGSNIFKTWPKTAPKVSYPTFKSEHWGIQAKYPKDFLLQICSDRLLAKLPIHSCSLSHTHLDLIPSCSSSNAWIKRWWNAIRIHHFGSKKKLLWKNAKHLFMAHKHWKLRAPCANMFHS